MYFWKNKQNTGQVFKDKAGIGMRTTAYNGQLVLLVIPGPFSSGVILQLSFKKKKKVKYTPENIIYSSTNSNLCFKTYDFGHEK